MIKVAKEMLDIIRRAEADAAECENIALSAKQTASERCDELSAIAQSNREKVAASVIKEICGK